MGWFLSKNSKKKKTGKKKTSRRTTTSKRDKWDPQRTYAALRILGGLVVVIAIAAGAVFADRLLQKRASGVATREYPVQIELADAPEWMSRLLRQDLTNLVDAHVSADPLAKDELMQAAQSLAANAWVERVERIERLPRGQVKVFADYREPVALVQSAHGYHLVNKDGVQLPGLYLSHQVVHLDMPVIEGVSTSPLGPGLVWQGADLRAGLDLVREVRGQPYIDQVRAIDVSGRDDLGRIRLVMHTTNGGMVRWGLPPGEEHPVEPTLRTKLNWLAGIYHQRGLIDAGGKVVDVFGGAVFVRSPESILPTHGTSMREQVRQANLISPRH